MSNASAISECHQTAISSCRITHSLILIVTLTLNAQTQVNDAKSRKVDLKRGQMLELSLVTPLDSGHARVGDDVVMRLPRPLMANGVTVLPVDSFVRARITNVTHAGKNCRSGRIDFEIGPVKMSDGTEVKIRLVETYIPMKSGSLPPDSDVATLERFTRSEAPAPVKTVAAGTSTVRPNPRSAKSRIRALAELPSVIATVPLWIPVGIAMSIGESCDGSRGTESLLPAGRIFFATVSKESGAHDRGQSSARQNPLCGTRESATLCRFPVVHRR